MKKYTQDSLKKKIIIVFSQLLIFFQSYSIFSGSELVQTTLNFDLGFLSIGLEPTVFQFLLLGLLLSSTIGFVIRKSWPYILNGVLSSIIVIASGFHLESLMVTYEIASSSLLVILSFFLAYWFQNNSNFEESWLSLQKNFVLFLSTLFIAQGVEIMVNSFLAFPENYETIGSIWQLSLIDDIILFATLGAISVITGFLTLIRGRSIALQYLILWGGMHVAASLNLLTIRELGVITLVLPAAILSIEGLRFFLNQEEGEASTERTTLRNVLLASYGEESMAVK